MHRILKQIFYLVLIAVLLFLVTGKRAPELSEPVKMVEQPGKYASLPFDDLRKLMPIRIQYIKDKSTFLEPYDKEKFEFLSQNISSAGNEQIVTMMLSMPNGELGYYRLDPIKEQAKLTSFQFEQGMTGWFWIYGTFIDSAGSPASFMYYLIRLDMFPPDLRKEMNLPMGSTTYYYISCGVGKGNVWHYYPFKICRGEYDIKSPESFSFSGLDLPKGWKSTLRMNGTGLFNLESKWADSSGKQEGFSVELKSKRPPFLNGPEGCAPCSGGAGTLYFSYTELNVNGSLMVDDSASNYSNGTGWVDRQWLNREVSSVYLSLLVNATNLFKAESRGLGKYIWLNLHLGADLQYMVSGLFAADEVVTKGTKFKGIVNKYGPDKVEYDIGGEVQVMDTLVLGGTAFPIKYQITTKDATYILDGSKFPKSVSIDPSNNLHWNGSGIVYDSQGKMLGTGFLEANQFADNNLYVSNTLRAMGLNASQENIRILSGTGKLSLAQGLPNIIVIILVVGTVFTLLILFVRGFRKK